MVGRANEANDLLGAVTHCLRWMGVCCPPHRQSIGSLILSVVGLRAEHIISVMRINILNLPANLSPQYLNQKTGRNLGDH